MEAVAIRGGVWHLVQSKTGAALFLPVGMVPGLSERIAEQQARNRAMGYQGERIIVSEATGQPYLEDGEGSTDHFSRRFARVRTLAAETMPDCRRLTFQKLRRFANIEAEDAGVSDSQSNSVGGWRDGSTAKARYRARTLRQAESVFEARLSARGEAVGT